VQGHTGVGIGGSSLRYVALPSGPDTVVQRVSASPWRVRSTIRVSGRYGIPGAAYDGSTTGLSADGRTLILEQVPPRSGVKTTRLLDLDARRMAVRRRIALPGWSTVDAISPDGRWIYLIHYRSSDITNYEVLAYDLRHGRMLTKPIVDPRDRDEAMTGFPVSRVMGAGGRWAYTLYGRPSNGPFIHALDTVDARARCIDLPSLADADFASAQLQLSHGGATLRVSIGGVVRATINTRTFAVSSPAPVAALSLPTHPAAREDAGDGSGVPWELLLPVAALAALGAAAWRRARPRAT
jgi:hypothetical protein